MGWFENILVYNFMGNSGKDYLIAIAILLGSLGILKIFKHLIIARLKKLAKKTKNDVDDLIVGMMDKIGSWPLFFFVSLYLSLKYLAVPQWISTGVKYTLLIIVTYYTTKAILLIIDYSALKYNEKKGGKRSSAARLLANIIKGTVWLIAILAVLQNMGINVSSLIAGLGVGGIAIAFALQNILSDIFASFSIYFDKPFEEGDYIVVGSDSGVVKRIGIKSTRIRTLKGQELIISNKELTGTRINNYKRMEKRRVSFTIGIVYGTPLKKIKKVNKIIEDIFKSEKDATLDRVHFKEFGDFSLNFEIVYYVNSSDYLVYMNTQQSVNLKIYEAFEKEKIEFAYPTQSIFIEKGL